MPLNANDRSIVGLTMIGHGLVHTYELSIPILMTIWLTEFDTTTSELGLVVAVGYALFGIGALPGGLLTDKFGSRRLIIGCLAGMGGSFLLLSAAGTLSMVAAALFLWGTAASVYHPSGLALISKGVTRRGSAFAYHGIAGSIGIALGPLLTSLLLLFFDWRIAAAVLALPALLGVLFALRVRVDEMTTVESTQDRRSGKTRQRPLRTFLANSRSLLLSSFLGVLTVAVLSGLYYRGILTFLPNLLSSFPLFDTITIAGKELQPARYIYTGLLMVGMFGQYVGGKLTDRIQVERGITLFYGVLAVIALLFIPAATAGVTLLLIAGACLGFFLFLVQPLYQAMVAEHSPASLRGLSYGYAYLAIFGIGAAGAAITGFLLDYFTPQVMFAVLAGFAALAALAGGILLKRRNKTSPEAAAAS